MAGRLLKSTNILIRYLFYRKLSETSVLGINLSSNYCNSVSVGSQIFIGNKKLKIKKKGQSSNVSYGNISDTINKASFTDTTNAEEISSLNSQNLETNVIAKDLFNKKIQKIKNQIFSHSLESYISACNYSELYDAAFATFKHFRNLEKNSEDFDSLNLKPYNEILKGIANQGDLKKMKEVLNMLEESFLKPDYNTVGFCLTCLGRNENTPSVIDEIKIILDLMNQHNITFYDILSKAYFPRDSLELCLQAIERVTPNVRNEIQSIISSKEFVLKENSYNNNKLVNELNKSSFINQRKSPAEGVVSNDELKEMIQRQIDNELKGSLEIPLINKNINPQASEAERKLWQEWNEDWRRSLHKTLDKYKTFMKKSFSDSPPSRPNEYPYLNALSNDEIVELLLQEVRNLCVNLDSKTYNVMAWELGHKFYSHYQLRYQESSGISSVLREVYEKYSHWYLLQSDSGVSYIPRIEWNYILAKENPTMNRKENPVEWPYTAKLAIGHKLYKFVFESLNVWQPGKNPRKAFMFFAGGRTNNNKMTVVNELMKIFSVVYESMLIPVPELPMLSPPIPYTDLTNGGYIFMKSRVLKLSPTIYHPLRWLEEEKVQNLYPAMDSLNAVGSIPWKINCIMLDIIIGIFKSGGWPELGISPYMSGENTDKRDILERKQLRKGQTEFYDQHIRLSVANYYRNSVIWFPHNVDFRGRRYSTVRYFGYFLNDLYRSFMVFAQGKKLGKDGLIWLKLHLCNLSGMKKFSSIEDRLKFIDEMMDEIIDSAKNPLNGNKWWTECNLPWQTLAACKELVAALESESPEDYVSHLPIHQDGTSNVLQHFAALMRDKKGAALVNLSPNDTPQDVYGRIIESMKKIGQKDASEGVEIAVILRNYLERKIIKPAIIASIYGASLEASFSSLIKSFRDKNFAEDYREAAAKYLTSKTSESLNTVFPSLKPVKDWMVKLAEGISQHCISNVEFESPLGFPISQPNVKEQSLFLTRPDIVTNYSPGSIFKEPSIDDQKNGFVGNYIQSMDAAHMILTSLVCQQSGVTFVSVHDSFWSHPSTIPAMNKICREEFIRLYSQPILENLAKVLIEKYSSHPNYRYCYTTLSDEDPTPASLEVLLQNVPPQIGDFDLNEVNKSTFFFS